MSNDVFSNFSSHINMTKGFENVMASFSMIRSPYVSRKNKRLVGTTNLVFAFEGGLMILF
jgi:hypothetical protein